ncbi:hypothetical protein CH063_15213 [Colletotrichum higginsianum]|uniref:Uncharacterized protein n=1 Tax=Colletotrichum higginsianum (strain IMI 349063) TaxID=759273 RepID=H1W1W7_COLHI|nr:hypothetical protein CH063_15213 [Colletotrichum higginsianum]
MVIPLIRLPLETRNTLYSTGNAGKPGTSGKLAWIMWRRISRGSGLSFERLTPQSSDSGLDSLNKPKIIVLQNRKERRHALAQTRNDRSGFPIHAFEVEDKSGYIGADADAVAL